MADPAHDQMLREYRLIQLSDRATQLLVASSIIFIDWCFAAIVWHRLFNLYLLGFLGWVLISYVLNIAAKKRYRTKSVYQDPLTSRAMYKATFIDKLPEKWYAATRAAGVYEGKSVSDCDPTHFRGY